MIGQARAKGVTLPRPGGGVFDADARKRNRLGAMDSRSALKFVMMPMKPGILPPDDIARRHAHIVKMDGCGVRHPPPHFVQWRAGHPRPVRLDQ